jgi:hypothetical protein
MAARRFYNGASVAAADAAMYFGDKMDVVSMALAAFSTGTAPTALSPMGFTFGGMDVHVGSGWRGDEAIANLRRAIEEPWAAIDGRFKLAMPTGVPELVSIGALMGEAVSELEAEREMFVTLLARAVEERNPEDVGRARTAIIRALTLLQSAHDGPLREMLRRFCALGAPSREFMDISTLIQRAAEILCACLLDIPSPPPVEIIEEPPVQVAPEPPAQAAAEPACVIVELGDGATAPKHGIPPALKALMDTDAAYTERMRAAILGLRAGRSMLRAFEASLGMLVGAGFSPRYIWARLRCMEIGGTPQVFYGRVHEWIRAGRMAEGNVPMTDLGKRILGPDESMLGFDGWVYDEARHVIRRLEGRHRLGEGIDADVYDRASGTVYEIKSIREDLDKNVARLISLMARSGRRAIDVSREEVPNVRTAIRLFNQVKKLAMAVQTGIIQRVEFHITTPRALDPRFLLFMQTTIPNVVIMQYASFGTAYKKAVRIHLVDDDIRWTGTSKTRARKYVLVGGSRRFDRHYDEWGDGGVLKPAARVELMRDVKPLPLDDGYMRMLEFLGTDIFPEAVLQEEHVPVSVRARFAALGQELRVQFEHSREALVPLLPAMPGLGAFVRDVAARLREFEAIPENVGERAAFLLARMDLKRDVVVLNRFAHAYQALTDAIVRRGAADPSAFIRSGLAKSLSAAGINVAAGAAATLTPDMLSELTDTLLAASSGGLPS